MRMRGASPVSSTTALQVRQQSRREKTERALAEMQRTPIALGKLPRTWKSAFQRLSYELLEKVTLP